MLLHVDLPLLLPRPRDPSLPSSPQILLVAKLLRILVLQLHLLPRRELRCLGVFDILELPERMREGALGRGGEERAPVELAFLDDEVVERALLVRLAQKRLLDGVLRDEAVDVHVADLADAVGSAGTISRVSYSRDLTEEEDN